MQPSFESSGIPDSATQDDPAEREAALRRRAVENLQARAGLAVQGVLYLLVNAFLFWIWASNGAGFPWPLFVLVFWGIGLFWQAWALFGPGESEERVRREMDRLRGKA